MGSSTKRRAATKTTGPKRRSPKPGPLHRLRAAGGRWVASDEGFGSALALAALLGVVGLWLDITGPVGHALSLITGAVFGLARHLTPVVLGVLAAAVFSGRRRELPRLGIGLLFAGSAVTGLLHLTGHGAGGLVGVLVGHPLRSAAGPWGAGLLLGAVGAVGLLVLFHLSFGQVVSISRRAAEAAAGLVRRGLIALFTLSSERAPGPAARPPVPREPKEMNEAEEPIPAIPVSTEDLVLRPTPAYRAEETGEMRQLELGLPPGGQGWKLPPVSLLTRRSAKPVDRRLIERGGQALEATLGEFGVDAGLVGMTIGPTVTRYELELGPGVKVNKVTGLSHDIAYAMGSPDVRIIAPIPGRSAIGVEVPNRQRQLVTLGDILDSEEAGKALHPLEVGLGRDIAGRPVTVNLAGMPHLLIAGATGAGKSSCINSLITSVIMRSTPDQVRLILVDPKRVELGVYNEMPHLLTPVVVNPKKAANALDWAVREMELRYDLLAEVGVRDITGYNAAFDRGDLVADAFGDTPGPGTATRGTPPTPGSGANYERLPYILVVVDELNDLMMVAARDVEASICRIAQMARAVGIHLVIATQRPSVDVITGVIKANIPSRLAFSVSSLADSRVILDTAGAEKLVGQGDMLLLTASSSRPQRIQGAWVEEADVRKVVAYWRRQTTELGYVEGLAGDGPEGAREGAEPEEGDDLLDEAMELVIRSGLGSTSMLQRKLRVGFARAGRLMDLLERRGIVGPSEGSKSRAVLMTVEELDDLQSRR